MIRALTKDEVVPQCDFLHWELLLQVELFLECSHPGAKDADWLVRVQYCKAQN